MEVVLAAGITGLLALAGTYLTVRSKIGSKNGHGSVLDMLATVIHRQEHHEYLLDRHGAQLDGLTAELADLERREQGRLDVIETQVVTNTTALADGQQKIIEVLGGDAGSSPQ